MSATLSAGIDSLTLKIKTPMESDGVTPRDDLIGVKVWYSTTTGFTPPGEGTLAYDGTGLDISITGLTSGTLYYVRYALVSEIEPDNYTLSTQLSATPVYETQTVDATPPPTPTGVSVTAGVGTVFIKHDVPTYALGRGHKKTHVFALKETAANTQAGYTFANAAAAGEIGQFTGNFWSFSSDPATKWHIWLKWETNNGVLSNTASGGTTGDTATTSQDVSTLLSALTDQVTSSQLSTSLRSNVTNLNSQYTIKVGSGGQIAGFGIASTANDSGNATSDFGIQADKFWIAPPAIVQATAPTTNLYRGLVWVDSSGQTAVTKYYTGTAWSTTPQTVLPFSVVTTPQTIGGQTVNPGVYIDAAYIKDGTITNAKIGDATISAAKIGSVDATKITVNQLTASQINSNGLSIRDSAGNLLLDASNSQLGVSLYVGSGSNKRLLSTVGAFAATPNTAYIGEFSSAPTFVAARDITSWFRISGITYVTTSAAHGFVLGTKVTIASVDATFAGTYEIIEIPSSSTFKIVNNAVDRSGTTATATGYLYAENSVYKNTTDNNSYILTGSTLAWALFLEKGKTPVLGTDYYQPATFDITNSGATFSKNAAGTISPDSITLTTAYANIAGTPTYQWYKDDTAISGATASSYAVPKADYTSTISHAYKCIVTGTINGTANSTKQDTITIPLLVDGKSSIQVVVSNENISFAAPNSGYSGITFTGGSTTITAYIGTTQLAYGTSGANTFSVSLSIPSSGEADLISVVTGSSGNIYTINAPTAMLQDSLTVTATVTVRDASSTATTVVKGIRYSLSRAGAKPVAGTDYTVTNGTRGSAWAYLSGYTSWSDNNLSGQTVATPQVLNTYFTNTYGGKVINDAATVYGTGFSETRVWDGSSWNKVAVAIDGNLMVKGTIASDRLVATTLEGVSATIGTLRSRNTGARMEIADDIIRVYDANNTVRVRLGNLSL